MDFVRNILRCLFLGIRRSRRRILVSVLIIVTLWHLHLFNSGHINRIQVVREPATRLDVNLRFNSLRERIFGNDPKNHQGERIIISEGTEKRLKNQNHTDKSVGLHSSLQSLKRGDTQSYSGKGKSFSDLHSHRNASSACREFSLTDANKNSYGTCQPHKASLDACDFADSLYRYDSSLSVCKINKENAEICSLASDVHHERTMLKAKCNGQVCEGLVNKNEKKFVTYGVYSIDPDEGVLESIRDFETVSELETQLPRIALLTSRNKFNFLFVKCLSISSNETLASQLVQVPPLATIQEAVKPRPKNNININIVLLDSVSRAHFYRSLPKTIETFRKLSKRRDISPARVFDFELFQAVHGHTTQNEHALFTGKLLPSTDQEDEPSEPVRADVLFGHFKRAGYQTMWQEDLCWTGVWGLMADLNAEDWEELQIKLRENFIDNTGLTHSSCEVLASFGLETPFNGPEGDQICFNGKLQHSYFLQYSTDMLNAIASSRKSRPLLSYTALNVGHDETGRRIQSLDSELARYVSAVANDENTLTIVLADHGNTYTKYTSDILEGRFEIFHPSLFVIVPNKVAALLGADAVAALEVNQKRLVTMIDLHHSLLPLARPLTRFVKPVGLFTPVSPNRTCNDIELRTPNLCVCDGWDSPTTNDSSKISIVEFVVGELNNMLQDEFNKLTKGKANMHPILRACERLRPLRFENVRERNSKSDGGLITSFDIYFRSGNVVRHKEDIFHVEVKSKELANHYSLQMELVNYDRLTLFGKYHECADQGVRLKLCICSKRMDRRKTNLENAPWRDYSTFLFKSPKARNVGDTECLFLLKRNHSLGQSVAFEIANTCPNKMFTLKISAHCENMRLSREVPFEIHVQPASIKFLLSARIAIDFWSTFIEVYVDVHDKK